MMKKARKTITLMMFVSMIFACTAFAVGESVPFTIKAYKIDVSESEPSVRVVITDALSNHLDIHGQDGEIDLTEELGSLLGTSPSIEDFDSSVIFSYRVEGNKPGSYTLDFSLSRFDVDENTASNGGDSSRNDKYIDAYYEIEYNTLVFASSASNGNLSAIDVSKKSGGTNSSNPVNLSVNWSATNNGQATMSPWIARGAVGTVISNIDLQNAMYGVYRADITVTLTSN